MADISKGSNCPINMEYMTFSEINFKRTKMLKPNNTEAPHINVVNGIYHVTGYTYIVILGVIAEKEDEYSAKIMMRGQFTIKVGDDGITDKHLENLLNVNIPAIMFPYLRAKLTELLCQPYGTPYVFPICNMSGLIDYIPLNRIMSIEESTTTLGSLYSLNYVPEDLNNRDLEVRDKIVQHIFDAKYDMWVRKCDNSLAMNQEGFSRLVKHIAEEYDRSRYGAEFQSSEYSYSQTNTIMEFFKIPLKFILINDSERPGEISFILSFDCGEF